MNAKFHPVSIIRTLPRLGNSMILLLVIFSLLLSACRPSPGPGVPPDEISPATPDYSPTSTMAGLPVIDTGEPLPVEIIDVRPPKGQGLPTSGKILLTFNQPMDIEKTSAAWELEDDQGKTVPGNIQWISPRSLEFTPQQSLKSGSVYKARVNMAASSATGVTLVDPVLWEYETLAPLQVIQVFPHHRAREIANNATITVIFNRPVVPLVIAEEKSQLPDPLTISPSLPGKGEWINTSVYAFNPTQPLLGSTTYTVTVKAGLQDAGKETTLAEDFSWEFSTIQPSLESLSLSNGQVNPENFYKNVRLDETFTLSFFQPMEQTSTQAAITLVHENGEEVLWDYLWNEDATQIVITPTLRLAFGAQYTLTLSDQAEAAGGGKLDEGLKWSFYTLPEPQVIGIEPKDQSVANIYNPELRIRFASPMNIESVKENIIITPQPEEPIEWWYNEWDWSISGYFLRPSTHYRVQLLPGMQDIYGNTIDTPQTLTFTTGPYEPSAYFEMPYQPSILRQGGSQEFYIAYRNIQTVTVRMYRLDMQEFVNFLNYQKDPNSFQGRADQLIWQVVRQSRGEFNERVLEALKPELEGGKPLEQGFYILTLNSPDVAVFNYGTDTRLVLVTNSSLNFKSSASDNLVWLTDLNTGEPLVGVPVTIYDENLRPTGKGKTDADGLFYLEPAPVKQNFDARYALAEDAEHFAFTASHWDSGISMWDYGIWGSYFSPANQPTVYVYTERPIYRPGQPVYYKGIVRLDEDLAYHLPDIGKVHVTIENFKETVFDEQLALGKLGSFAGEFKLDPDAALGYYTMNVMLPGSEQIIGSVTFNVAEYRRPEFKVTVSADPQNILNGDSFTATVNASYYSGGNVKDAQVSWTLVSNPYRFSPPEDLSMFSFADFEEYTDFYESEDTGSNVTIAKGQGVTDQDGVFAIDIPVDLSPTGASRTLTFEASLTDISQNSVSNRAVVVGHRSQVYPGVRPMTSIGTAGKPSTLEIVTVDWAGAILPGQKVSLEIVERRWYSVQEQDAEGRVKWTYSVEEIPVTSFENLVTNSNGRIQASFTPPNGGIFRARVKSLDTQGNEGRASTYVWIAGEDYIPWRQSNDRSFELVTDKPSYTPGETASILIASPFQGSAYALVTVERGRIHYQDVILLEHNSTIYKLPVTPDMAPNAYVSVLVVKGVDETNTRPSYRMGIIELSVDPRQQELQVELSSDPEQAGPGETVNYTIRTLDYLGEPVSAEVSLSLSDLATLSLMDPNTQSIQDFFYSKRTLGVWTSIPINLDIEEYNVDIDKSQARGEGMGGGGVKGEGDLGVVEIRQDFPDTAYWEAFVNTGDNGQANVTVTLPDNLTTWRMEARAVTAETLVGQATYDIISTKPLLVRPQTPRFFVSGDQVRLGAAVHNNTEKTLSVTVSLDGSGIEYTSAASLEVQILPGNQAYVTWDVLIQPLATRVDLVFRAESGELRDASRPTVGTLENQGLPVYRYDVPETVGTSGMISDGSSIVEAISLPESFQLSEGFLKIQISPSLAAGMTDGLSFLENFPNQCVEQTISRFLPNVLTTKALKSAGISDPALEAKLKEQVETGMQSLINWQNANGGWGWWSSQKSDPLTSAYVVLGLVEAGEAGYPVNEDMLRRGKVYLQSQLLISVGKALPERINRQAFLLYVLARAGKPNVSSSIALFENRQNTALYARAFMAQTLYIIDPQDPRLDTLLSDLNSAAILSATGTHWEEAETDRWNWNTDTRTTAIILSALSQIDPENPLTANAVRWLMSNRRNGHWIGTQETAWTLMALSNWMVASGELQADFQFGVALNGEQIGGAQANADTLRQNLELKVDIGKLAASEANRLVIARDAGPGNLYYTAHLKAWLPVDQVSALDQGLIISRNYYRMDDLQTPVSEARQGELLLARLTVVALNAVHFMLVDDPIPAGLEAIDQSLNTSSQNQEVPQVYTWEDTLWRGWGWWHLSNIQLRDEKVVLSSDYLPAGTYIYTYIVRASSVGVFSVIPPTAQEFYFPEVYGRGEGMLFEVKPAP